MHQHLAVLGAPIAHSRSPRIHAAAYERLGLPWLYDAIECAEGQLEALLASRDASWRGFSVTMPLKAEAHRLSEVRDPVAAETGVVNTLLRLAGNAGWAGFNTDVAGLAAALREAELDLSRTVVLGAGATAVSAVLAARWSGAERVVVRARRPEAAQSLAARFDGTGSGRAPLEAVAEEIGAAWQDASPPTAVISTLPGSVGRELALPGELLAAPLFDVAYDPWPSPLASRWRESGARAHAGLDMLLHQALVQVRIFVGGDPALPLEQEAAVFQAMREAVGGDA